jgi:hypothetical protein
LEKDLGKGARTKIFIGLIVICVSNDYKNYLTIDLVFPRAESPIRNITELLDLNFNIIQLTSLRGKLQEKAKWLEEVYFHLEIDARKREKYIREVDWWLQLIPRFDETFITKVASGKERNSLLISGSYQLQVYFLNIITLRNYPNSCHFVKRPFASHFQDFYFLNPKAEGFKSWTAKFLDHGFFEFWKRSESYQFALDERKESAKIRSKRYNSSSEGFDFRNFIGQAHLSLLYIVVSVFAAICIVVFVSECALPKLHQLSLLAFVKIQHFSLQLLWTVVYAYIR